LRREVVGVERGHIVPEAVGGLEDIQIVAVDVKVGDVWVGVVVPVGVA
jgi:hypothetical protein